MRIPPRLVELTPEGRILSSLIGGGRSYSALKEKTGLSDRWLSRKLEDLKARDIVEKRGELYQAKQVAALLDSEPFFAGYVKTNGSLRAKASLIAEELAKDEGITAIILFGSAAKGSERNDSDIDLAIVTETETEEELNERVYDAMFKHNAPVEAVFMTYEDLLINLHVMTSLAFGLLEGYQVLYDRDGVESLFSIKKRQMLEGWAYNEEAGAWVPKKLSPILKQQKNS